MYIKIDRINYNGTIYKRYEFESLEDLEIFYWKEIFAKPNITYREVIGKVLIWRDENDD